MQQDGWYIDNVKVSAYSGLIPTTFQVTVQISNGWNMVSIPGIHPDDQNVDNWWSCRDPAAGVFRLAVVISVKL